MKTEQAVVMNSPIPEINAALAVLEGQGLTIRLHNGPNNTWHIADGGLYSGYVVSEDELIELGRSKKLNMKGIKGLG